MIWSTYILEEAKGKDSIPHDDGESEQCRCHYLSISGKKTCEDMQGGPGLSNLYD